MGQPPILHADDVGGIGEADVVFGARPLDYEGAADHFYGDFFYLAAGGGLCYYVLFDFLVVFLAVVGLRREFSLTTGIFSPYSEIIGFSRKDPEVEAMGEAAFEGFGPVEELVAGHGRVEFIEG